MKLLTKFNFGYHCYVFCRQNIMYEIIYICSIVHYFSFFMVICSSYPHMKDLFVVLLFVSMSLSAQNKLLDPNNLVPNPSFELQYANQIGWFYKGEDFNKAMKYWKSPTGASPDAYNAKTRVPPSWAQYGFGEQKPHLGEGMVGLTLFGCTNGKPHCREYIQIQLLEPLIKGQQYYLEFYTTHLERSMQISQLGVAFTTVPIILKADTLLTLSPTIVTKKLLAASAQQWLKVSARFKATKAFNYLILGNFFSDSLTFTKHSMVENPLNYAYYYVDDVLLKKIPPYLPQPELQNELRKKSLVVGKAIVLENIYFSFDEAELLPRSILELNVLVDILRKNPTMQIEVNGHTDNLGGKDYNLKLSEDRAFAVMNFLTNKGISSTRLKHSGYGSSKPMFPNDSETHRNRNRRVEILIVHK